MVENHSDDKENIIAVTITKIMARTRSVRRTRGSGKSITFSPAGRKALLKKMKVPVRSHDVEEDNIVDNETRMWSKFIESQVSSGSSSSAKTGEYLQVMHIVIILGVLTSTFL